jgi:hypothetical protein
MRDGHAESCFISTFHRGTTAGALETSWTHIQPPCTTEKKRRGRNGKHADRWARLGMGGSKISMDG